MLRTLATLLVFQCIGEGLVFVSRLPVPGPVVGMALLLVWLALRPAELEALKPAALELLRHLSLLFVPAGVGVMLHLDRIGREAVAITVALAASTALAIVATALAVRAAEGWLRRGPATAPPDDAAGR